MGVTYIIVAVIVLFIIIDTKIKKYIHEIEINYDRCIALFKTYRSAEVLEAGFDELIINKKFGFLIFQYKDKKLIYNGEITDELANCVNMIMKGRINDEDYTKSNSQFFIKT